MNRCIFFFRNYLLVIFALVYSNTAFSIDNSATSDLVNYANESYIIIFNDNVNVDGEINRIKAKNNFQTKHVYSKASKGFSAKLSSQSLKDISKSKNIKIIEKNGLVTISVKPSKPSKPGKPGDSGSNYSIPQTTSYGVLRVGGPLNGQGFHVWILDTGVDENNKDLNIEYGANFISDRKGKRRNNFHDGNGHGTHVAGIVAAINNDIDAVGVAAGASVHPIRVLDDNGVGTIDTVLAGIDYVAANANTGDVVNLSLSASGHYQSLHEAILNVADLGIMFSLAGGNSASDASNYEPAHIAHPNVYTISTIDQFDQFALSSNYGNPPIDYAAPGVNIESLKIGGGLTLKSGTSMAAPHVAGILLLTQSSPNISGYANNDPDGIHDSIAHY